MKVKIQDSNFKFSVSEVLDRYDIEVAGEDENNYICRCVFHDDTGKPNLSIEKQTGLYRCWSCSAAGNLTTLVAHCEGVSTKQAYKILLTGEENVDVEYLKPFQHKDLVYKVKDTKRLHLVSKYMFTLLYGRSLPKFIVASIKDREALRAFQDEQDRLEEDLQDTLYRRQFTLRKRQQLLDALKTVKFLPEKDRYRVFIKIITNSQISEQLSITLNLVDSL